MCYNTAEKEGTNMKTKNITEETDKCLAHLDKSRKVGDIITEITASVCLTSGVMCLLSTCLNEQNTIANIAIIAGGTVLLSPLTYFGFKKLQKKSDNTFKREIHSVGQLMLMMKEATEPDRVIGKMTSFFLPQIIEIFDKDNVSISQDDLMNVNQFIYLINCNYYEQLRKYIPESNREQLIKSMIRQTSMYLRQSDRHNFNEKDAKKVLNNCIFIPKKTAAEIAEEFKKSKVKFLGNKMYEIIRNDVADDIDAYISAKDEEEQDRFSSFDSNNIEHYKTIIESVSKSEYIQNLATTNPSDLKWDIDFLMRIMNIITKDHREELVQRDNMYQNFPLVISYIYNALAYAVVNNKKEVGKTEMINTFKNWDYIPFDMKLDVIDKVFEEYEIDYKEHPYKFSKTKIKNRQQKIIAFRPEEQ